MSRAAERQCRGTASGGSGLPRRPAAGTAQAMAHLDYPGTHRAPGRDGPGWVKDVGLLRRVRDALASGRQP
jgi:hypothetical protein